MRVFCYQFLGVYTTHLSCFCKISTVARTCIVQQQKRGKGKEKIIMINQKTEVQMQKLQKAAPNQMSCPFFQWYQLQHSKKDRDP